MNLNVKANGVFATGARAARRKLPETLLCLLITLPFAVLSAWLSRLWRDATLQEGRWIFLAAQLPVGSLIFRFILRSERGLQVRAAMKDGLLHAAIYAPLLCLCVGLRIGLERLPPWLRLGTSSDGALYLYIAAFAFLAYRIHRWEKAKTPAKPDSAAVANGALPAAGEGPAQQPRPDPDQGLLFDPERYAAPLAGAMDTRTEALP